MSISGRLFYTGLIVLCLGISGVCQRRTSYGRGYLEKNLKPLRFIKRENKENVMIHRSRKKGFRIKQVLLYQAGFIISSKKVF